MRSYLSISERQARSEKRSNCHWSVSEMELVSVIIPVYNVEKYLDRCICSVVKQTYQNLEIILVNDGSSDKCPEICDAWTKKDDRITVIHQSNCGVSSARNAGLKAATGSFLLQIDSDDYIAPEAVERLVCTANETSSDMVICDFMSGSEENYSFSLKCSEKFEILNSEIAISRIYADKHSALKYAAPWCKLCKHSLYDGISYPEGKIFEDIYTTHKLLYRCHQIAVLEVPLFYYYQRPDSIMNAQFSLKKLDYLQALVERVEFFDTHDLKELESIAYDDLLHSLIWEYSRTRDILHSEEGVSYVKTLFKQVYKKNYSSRRYPEETATFLAVFNQNPEWIILYWRISSLFNRIFKRQR